MHGPPGTRERISGAFESPPADDLIGVYDFRVVGRGHAADRAFRRSRTALMNHPAECYGVRLEAGGSSLVYSGDTGRCPELVELARDTDLLLCEASWLDDPAQPPDVHLSGKEAGEHAQAAGARRLLLTHIVPWADANAVEAEARAAYDGPVERAACGRSYEV